jgi:hypothetical protein
MAIEGSGNVVGAILIGKVRQSTSAARLGKPAMQSVREAIIAAVVKYGTVMATFRSRPTVFQCRSAMR